jgi:ribonuclease HI
MSLMKLKLPDLFSFSYPAHICAGQAAKSGLRRIEIYVDGASKGNPGPAAIGVVVLYGGEVVKNISQYIGQATNNFAEYSALIFGLKEACMRNAEAVVIYSDSQLLCRQLKKEYKVKSESIKGLYRQATRLLSAFKEVSIKNIPREENRGADKLANLAIKAQAKKVFLKGGQQVAARLLNRSERKVRAP